MCAARSTRLRIPVLDGRGTPLGVDARRVVQLGVTPRITTGVLHASAGTGQVGAGVADRAAVVLRRRGDGPRPQAGDLTGLGIRRALAAHPNAQNGRNASHTALIGLLVVLCQRWGRSVRKCSESPSSRREVLTVDLDLERPVENEDQLLPRVLHRLVAAVGIGLHGGDGAGQEEAAVGSGDARQLDALVSREQRAAAILANVGDRPILAGLLLDEVRHRSVERGSDLEERGDGGDHAPALDLVDRRRRHIGQPRQLLERHPPLDPELAHLGTDRADDLVQLPHRVFPAARGRRRDARCRTIEPCACSSQDFVAK